MHSQPLPFFFTSSLKINVYVGPIYHLIFLHFHVLQGDRQITRGKPREERRIVGGRTSPRGCARSVPVNSPWLDLLWGRKFLGNRQAYTVLRVILKGQHCCHRQHPHKCDLVSPLTRHVRCQQHGSPWIVAPYSSCECKYCRIHCVIVTNHSVGNILFRCVSQPQTISILRPSAYHLHRIGTMYC